MSKPSENPKKQAAWIAAIGEPTRLALLRILATGEKTVTELAKACRTEIVNVSHHLSLLKAAGLVTAEPDGRFMRYNLVGATATASSLELTHESGAKMVLPLN